ncbi:FtsX-like permease family protein [Nocardioides sp. Root140]|uniref:FtsX-like permease family protein n=1 Tax=Nocardioides sp. Root140 TaxID=1736460 RepID=UPI001F22736F|nr:FtsX-like permease family protein [Nocardioides sp. Root140]
MAVTVTTAKSRRQTLYVGWRDLVHAKGRFLLMAGVVTLIAVLVGLLSGLTRGLADESTSAITGLHTERLIFSGATADFSSSRVPTDGSIEGEPLGVATSRAATAAKAEPVTVMGVRPGSPIAPDADGVGHGKVVLTDQAAEDLDLHEGDELLVGTQEFTVTAVRGDASYSHVPVVWLDLVDWQSVTGATDSATVFATDSTSAPTGFTNASLDDSLAGIGAYSSENGSLQLIRGFLFAISALVVGSFFTVWTVQRQRDIAVLKALGASTGYLIRDALGQAALLLGLGVGLGAVIVVGVGALAVRAVPFVLDAATIGMPLLALVLLGLGGAALAVRRITSVDPLTALGSAR